MIRKLITSHIDITIVRDTRLSATKRFAVQAHRYPLSKGRSVRMSFVAVLAMLNLKIRVISEFF